MYGAAVCGLKLCLQRKKMFGLLQPIKNKEIKFPVLIMRRFSPRSMESVPFIFILINSTLNQDILALAKNIPANKPVKDKFITIGRIDYITTVVFMTLRVQYFNYQIICWRGLGDWEAPWTGLNQQEREESCLRNPPDCKAKAHQKFLYISLLMRS